MEKPLIGYVSLVSRAILGLIFVTSSFGKLTYPEARLLDPQIAGYLGVFKFIPLELVRSYVEVLPWIELVIGFCLILGVFSRLFAAVSIVVVVSFIIGNSVVLYQNWLLHHNLTGPCPGCFGDVVKLNILGALALDVLMVGMALPILLKGNPLASVDSWLLRRRRL